jgi:hypothetical protein
MLEGILMEYKSFITTGWGRSMCSVIIFFTDIVNDGRELKYTTKKVDFEGVLENCIPNFGPPCIMCAL